MLFLLVDSVTGISFFIIPRLIKERRYLTHLFPSNFSPLTAISFNLVDPSAMASNYPHCT